MRLISVTAIAAGAVLCAALICLPPPAVGQTDDSARQLQQAPQSPAVNTLPVKAKRWALIIGIDKYVDPQISSLKGADNDARVLSDSLVRYAGFPQDQVILLSTDQPVERQPTRTNILRRLSNLSAAVPKDGLLLVSFAGHGMERGGQAFLLPADAQISDQISFLEDTALSVNRIKDQIKQIGVSQVVFLLDACRNDPGGRADAPNPLSNAYTNAFNFDVRNREVQAFATIYATGIGQRAYEYTEKKQGYFSWAVVEGLKGAAANEKGEVTLAQLVKYVQEAVPKRIAIDLGSTKQQKPFAVIEGYRADELVVAVTSSASMPATSSIPSVASVDPAAIELSFWDSIKNSNNPDDFKAYLDKYPDGQFASLAKLRAQPARSAGFGSDSNSMELTYWSAIKDSRNSADFKAYIAKFPNGVFTDLAASRVSALEAEERDRAAAKERSVEDTTWIGEIKTKSKTYGTEFKVEFLKGGVFTANYEDATVTKVPGFLVDSYKTEPKPVNISGTWQQDGDSIVVQMMQPQPGVLRLMITNNKIEGAIQGGDKFEVEKVLMKPMSSQPCDLRGFSIVINYRVKDKIDRTAEANKIGERLKGFGMNVKVEQYNEKYFSTGLRFHNGQEGIAKMIVECIKDISPLETLDQGASRTSINRFALWLQK